MDPSVAYVLPSAAAVTLFGVMVLASLRVLFGPLDPRRDDGLFTAIRVVGWTMALGGALVGLCAAFGPLGFLFWGALGAVAIDARMKRRRSQQYGLLWLMTLCAERLIPLRPALVAFAWESRGRLAQQVLRLAELIDRGVPLAEACRGVRRVFPSEARPLVAFGAQTGTLAPALRRAASQRRYHEEVLQNLTGRLAYMYCMLCLGPYILSVLAARALPSLRYCYNYLHADLSAETQTLLEVADLLDPLNPVLIVAELALLFLFFYVLARCIGLTTWDLPGTGWITRRLHTATLLDGLAVAVEHKVPLGMALGCLWSNYPKASIRGRLSLVLHHVQLGGDWCEAMLRAGLLRPGDVALLQAAERVGNLSWAMSELADSIRRRFAYRYHALLQTTFPIVVLGCGAAVLYVVAAIFRPLMDLIQLMI